MQWTVYRTTGIYIPQQHFLCRWIILVQITPMLVLRNCDVRAYHVRLLRIHNKQLLGKNVCCIVKMFLGLVDAEKPLSGSCCKQY